MPEPKTEARSHRPRRMNRLGLVIIVALLLIGLGVGATLWVQNQFGNGVPVTERQAVENDGNTLSTPEESTISGVVERVSGSIVSIVTEVETNNPFYGYSLQEGAGTGMIVGSNGYVLTNKHVIDG